MVYKWLNNIHYKLFPAHCMLCGDKGDHGLDLCQPCRNDLPGLARSCPVCALPLESSEPLVCGECLQNPPDYQRTFSALRYAPPLIPLITGLKFKQQLAPARLLGQLLADEITHNDLPRPDVLIPVPLHPKRIHERGFNQSIEIARVVARQHKLPMDIDICQRIRHTLPQMGLDATSRRKNIRGAFGLSKTCHYKHIAIIDDVITTGNTVKEIATLFAKNGVEQIQVWSISRATQD